VAALVAALALGGCSAGGGVRENPDGTLSIDCAGGYYDWTACHARAERACGQYEIVARVSNEGSSGVGTRDWSAEGSVVTRTLVVRCRG
jgi:hypothetical protein